MNIQGAPFQPKPSIITRPGILTLPDDLERYVVAAGGSVIAEIEGGDTVTVIDIEGLQVCEIITAASNGRMDATLLDRKPDGPAHGFLSILAGSDESAKRAHQSLKRRNIQVDKAQAIRVFGPESKAGDRQELKVQEKGFLIVCAPGSPMDAELQDTTTPIELFIKRTKLRKAGDHPLPEPLADPVLDFRIHSSTAESFTVKKGEYIQLIDVAGRQCSDFQAFSMTKLDKGNEQALDATITRTLTGLSNPIPGIPAKAFDVEMEPLVEVIQDTCGRHDVFLTACNRRYYEDMGYPGHVNCTDNFNLALDDFGIAKRKGWEALNYFYNTNLDDQNQFYFDEPWSRPGDYVMMRALTDLVCVASACPCDIDAANGWNPTDIHIRTYKADEDFKKATAFRMTPDATPELTKETAFHKSFSKFTRDFTEYNGYWLPNRFNNEGPTEEYWAAREKVVVMDLSPLRKYEVTGPDAEALMQYCVTRNIRKLSPGQVVYTAMCYEHGGMIDDGTVFRLDQDNFRWIGGNDLSGLWLREQAEKLGLEVWVRNSTDQLHNIAVQGPNSRELLKEIIWTPPNRPALEELNWFNFTPARIKEFEGEPVVVSRTGYSGELGYEVFCHPKDGEAVFNAVWEAGEKYGIKPLGLEALDWLRVEAGLIFANYEFDDTTDPFEAGIGFTVPLKSKEDDFIGREALIRRKEHPQKKLVGLEIHSQEPVGNGDCIHVGRPQIGEVTSGMRSPVLKKNIALARIDVVHAEPGTEVEIGKLDGHQKRLPATVVAFPHYDPKKERPRS
ncbi:MAG: DUF1989 domain-containing protein [Pseudomonadota bacterium]